MSSPEFLGCTKWQITTLKDICSIITDGTHHSPPNSASGEFPYVTAKNIKKYGLDISINLTYVSKEVHEEIYSRCPVEHEDILYIKDGATTGIAVINHLKIPFSMLSSVALIKPFREIANPYFLKHWLNSPDTYKKFISQMTGTAIRRVVLKQIREAEILLPPLAEQTRIAQKLDELLAQVDTLKARIDGIPALLKRFRQSVLTDAASGQLTKDWSVSKTEHTTWRHTTIGSVCSAAFDGPFGSKLKSDDYTNDGTRVIRLENIGHLHFIAEKKTFIGSTKSAELAKNKLETGDILFSSFVDEEIRVCQLPKSEQEFINKADCFCLRIDQATANPAFVMYLLATKHTYQRIKSAVHGATRPRINLGFLKSFEVHLPSCEEQTEIVRRVEQLFAFADQLEAKVASAKTRIDHLTQSILAKAFRGEIVPQDPNDEPASVLLERIKAQRAAAPKAKRGSKASA